MKDIAERMDDLERRIGRIENTLQSIMTHLRVDRTGRLTTRQQILPERTSSRTIRDAPKTSTDDVDPLQVDEKMDTAEIRTYTYHPLKTDPPEFRVLALHSSSQEADPIKCEIFHLSLTIDPKKLIFDRSPATTLTALSYTWRDMESKRSIIVDGKLLQVTKNLEIALRHMRKAKQPLGSLANQPTKSYWWVDAICINQNDIDERNQQVTLMTRIYKKASRVHVWLGEEADDSAAAMDLALQLRIKPRRGPAEPEIQFPTLLPDKELLYWRAFIAIFSRP
ncbi:hypothetical protein MMC17_006026 [Xylographa soralifera]|nr:hypothetical protein [Xylographa soralifera]